MRTRAAMGTRQIGLAQRARRGVLLLLPVALVIQGTAVLDAEPKAASSWEMPGRLSIHDLQLGPAVLKESKWHFEGDGRVFNASRYKNRLTLMVRFSYTGSRSGIPLKFVVKLPKSRQYEETILLSRPQGHYEYTFTVHRPEEFIGSGSVYVYYGFSIVDVLDFTIVPSA